MGRPTKEESLQLQSKRAVEAIRKRLPELADYLLNQAVRGLQEVRCPKCRHRFEVETGDPKIALMLWERVEGKPPEPPRLTDVQVLRELLRDLRELREPDESGPRSESDGRTEADPSPA